MLFSANVADVFRFFIQFFLWNLTLLWFKPQGGFLHLFSFSKLNSVSVFSHNVHMVKSNNRKFVLLLALLTKM